jgi:3-hydroxyisobutyrate dehydrogenase-like beta-hydroxyacid dehydrogenase
MEAPVKPVVAIIAQGQMGSAVGKRLTDNGVTVLTSLEGRSSESAKRAAAAGMKPVALKGIAYADIILSIVPPGEAEALAERLAPLLAEATGKPIYADCNAVNRETVERIARIIKPTGCAFVDAGIIGGPPKAGYDGPTFYLSGKQAEAIAALGDFGLSCKVLRGPVGAASALKMSYAGITKGLTALASVMILAASRAGTADALRLELEASQPQLLAWFTRQVPSMFDKAHRWVAEMEEIAGFVEEDPAGEQLFRAIAELYRRLAADAASAKSETGTLAGFFA